MGILQRHFAHIVPYGDSHVHYQILAPARYLSGKSVD